jgi:uncharacterized protein
MAITLYDASVARFLQTLGGVMGFLDRGLAWCRENGVDPRDIVETRLFHDMHPFHFQVVSIAHHSYGAIQGVQTGVFSPPPDVGALDYVALQKLISDAQDGLQRLTPDEVNRLDGRDLVFQVRDFKRPYVAEDFLLSFSLPNFYFHATTAYDILRGKGVPIGKRDFLGQPRPKG